MKTKFYNLYFYYSSSTIENLIRIIDKKYSFLFLIDDNEWVRTEIATKINNKYLKYIINYKYYYIRIVVAKRIDKKYLTEMLHDKNEYVRCEVIRRRLK